MGNNTEGARDMGNSENEESGRKMRSSEDWGEREMIAEPRCRQKHVLTYTCYFVIVTTFEPATLLVKSPPKEDKERERHRMADFGDHRSDEKTSSEPTHEKSYTTRAWEKGRKMAKRMVAVGLAISSVPILVPPLLLASTLSIAFAVPLGVFLAGYSCTGKIMTSILPAPHSYLFFLS